MAHTHRYEQDARAGRENFVVCSACSFSTRKDHVVHYAMVLDRQLSAPLLAERKERQAEHLAAAKARLDALGYGR